MPLNNVQNECNAQQNNHIPPPHVKVGATHALTKGEKHQMLKESYSVKDTKTVEDIKNDMVAKPDPKVKGKLLRILEEYCGRCLTGSCIL